MRGRRCYLHATSDHGSGCPALQGRQWPWAAIFEDDTSRVCCIASTSIGKEGGSCVPGQSSYPAAHRPPPGKVHAAKAIRSDACQRLRAKSVGLVSWRRVMAGDGVYSPRCHERLQHTKCRPELHSHSSEASGPGTRLAVCVRSHDLVADLSCQQGPAVFFLPPPAGRAPKRGHKGQE